MKKLKLLLILVSVLASTVQAADKIAAVDWTNIENAVSDAGTTHKFILVNIVAPWCGWCKKMDESTFTDGAVAEQLKNSFVSVKLDAENTSSVTFNGKSYSLVQNGTRKANQLALDLGNINGRLGYPTLVVLDEKGNKLQAFPGYKDAEALNMMLKYFTSGNYKTMDFQQFQSGQ